MKRLTVAVAALLASACGQQDLKPEEVRHAMPSASVLAITAPNPAAASPRLSEGGPQAMVAPVAGPAPLAVSSLLLATAVNGGVFWTLAPIAWFTQAVPPTRCDADSCTWGPGSGAADLNVWKLVVTRRDGAYDYTLSGAPKSTGGTAFVTVIAGRAWPGTLPNRGHGTFSVDFDAVWAGLDHAAGAVQQDFGTLDATYDARTGVSLQVTFLKARNAENPGADPANPNRVDAAYDFAAGPLGGDLQVGFRTLPAGATEQTAALHTRWQTAGAGRSDAKYTGPAVLLNFSQCWDGPPAWSMTFDSLGGTGSEAACVFATAAPPTIVIP